MYIRQDMTGGKSVPYSQLTLDTAMCEIDI